MRIGGKKEKIIVTDLDTERPGGFDTLGVEQLEVDELHDENETRISLMSDRYCGTLSFRLTKEGLIIERRTVDEKLFKMTIPAKDAYFTQKKKVAQ